MCAYAGINVCVRACVRACVRVCVCARARARLCVLEFTSIMQTALHVWFIAL